MTKRKEIKELYVVISKKILLLTVYLNFEIDLLSLKIYLNKN